MLKLYIFLLISTIVPIGNTFAQSKFDSFFEKTSIGGNFSLGFGSYTYVQVAPILYYNINEKLTLGLGVDYTYFKDNYYKPSISGSTIGVRGFGQYVIYENFFAHVEIQRLFIQDVYNLTPMPNDWLGDNQFFAGGGYRSWMSASSYTYILLLFDLERNDFIFGINPRIEVGFSMGL